jgi:acetoin utilization deacetylase AcuC-like enzyme
MGVIVFEHDAFGEHETPEGHAEQKPRYAAVRDALRRDGLDALPRREAPPAAREALLLAHPASHVDAVMGAAPESGIIALDPDTFMGPSSLEAALRGAGAAVAAVDAVFAGEADAAFAACRPPGHHTTPDRAMGFCLFNNAAIAARHARAAHGAARIAVADFDVHHGNGTQDIFWSDAQGFFASSHEWPQYPGTGRAEERGAFDNVRNAAIATGEGSTAFRRAWGETLLPALSAFDPDVIIVSAGFDAHAADPLGGLMLNEDDFDWITAEILAVARAQCGGKLVSVLEGGYDLAALGSSAAAHVKRLAA